VAQLAPRTVDGNLFYDLGGNVSEWIYEHGSNKSDLVTGVWRLSINKFYVGFSWDSDAPSRDEWGFETANRPNIEVGFRLVRNR
jgi:hypothetical protein